MRPRFLDSAGVDLTAIAVVVAAYLLGSVDFGVIVPRMRGVDIYSHGSGNPGTTNVLRAMGRKAAAMVMVGDLLKGLGAAALGVRFEVGDYMHESPIDLDVTLLNHFRRSDDANDLGFGVVHNLRASVGVVLHFGGRQP